MVMAIKVSQATIDKIKKMGMTKALKGASTANAEMREGLTRMYGAKRVAAATGKSTPARWSSVDQARSAAAPVRYKSADAARSAAMKSGFNKNAAADAYASAKYRGQTTAEALKAADKAGYAKPKSTASNPMKTAAAAAASVSLRGGSVKQAVAAGKKILNTTTKKKPTGTGMASAADQKLQKDTRKKKSVFDKRMGR